MDWRQVIASGAAVVAVAGCGVHDSLVFPEARDPFVAGPFQPWDLAPTPEPTPSEFGAGNGSDGDLLVAASIEPNLCTALVLGTGLEATLNASFGVGRALLLWQVTDVFATSGDEGAIVSPGDAGQWEIRRVTAVNGLTHTLDEALAHGYHTVGPSKAQACVIPEYANVMITDTGTFRAPPWNGNTGGIAVMAVSSGLFLAAGGSIESDARGFFGGLPSTSFSLATATLAEDTDSDHGGGKGGSLDGTAYGLYGRGNLGTGAGGGNTDHAGGGGGGNGGAGGSGGKDKTNTLDTRGRGGAALLRSVATHLSGGGGGGGGQQDTDVFSVGGNGGGVILLIVRDMGGSGTVHADGVAGTVQDHSGASGGGAGGTVLIEVLGSSIWSGVARARGGNGGDQLQASLSGTGGGGGGGRVRLVNSAMATTDVTAGISGLNVNGGNDPYGAAAGVAGSVETP